MDLLKVRSAIQSVLAYKQLNSLEVVTSRTHEVILNHLDSVNQIIGDFATATRTRTVMEPLIKKDSEGNEFTVTKKLDGKDVPVMIEREIVEIDYNTRSRVIEALKDLRDMVASKESKTNVNFGMQVAGNVAIGSRSFEDRIRKKREARGLKNDEDSVELPEIVDAEFDEDLADDVEEESSDESSS